MNKRFLTDIKNIKAAINANKLVVFAGAGISVDAGIPTWNTLIEEMQSEVDIPKDDNDYLRIAQMYYNDRQQKEYIEKVRIVLKYRKVKYNEIHEAIFKLSPEHILTTNYDDLLEQVIKKQSLPFSIVSKDKEFPYSLNTHLLVKIHGDLNDTDIVLKEDDYLDYSQNHPLIEAFIKSVFASKVVLFVGYSVSDINLKMIMQEVRNILGQDFQNAYLLSVDDHLHPAQKNYLQNKGINVICYDDATYKRDKNYIYEYLIGANALTTPYMQKGENLTDTGQKLLNFLLFISNYDDFVEPLKNQHPIDQLFLSLDRFSEFTSLPPNFIANLYPFNTSSEYVWNYEDLSIVTKNQRLIDLFFDQVQYEEEIRYIPPSDLKLTSSQIVEYNHKLTSVINKLNYSLIYRLFKQNATPDSFGYYGRSKEKVELSGKQHEKCNCLSCRLERFEINQVLTDVNGRTVDETTDIKEDLKLAYTYYKLGNFIQSYRLFDEVASKAWQTGSYFSYYIAKHNAKTLRNLVNYNFDDIDREKKNNLVKKIDDINLDKLLFQIPFAGKNEYKLLKAIRDDDILLQARDKIDETHDKIVDIYNNYERGNSISFGPNYPKIIRLELYKIYCFYTCNLIVADEYTNFKNVCQRAIDALLISYATNVAYSERLKELDKFLFEIIVFYGDRDDLSKTINRYKIETLVFKENDFIDIVDCINNFLKSFFTETKIFGPMTSANDMSLNQTTNYFFEQKCRAYFSKMFFLLSKIKFPASYSKFLIQNLIAFIKHENFLTWNEIKYLSQFMIANNGLFSQDNVEEILRIILNKKNYYGDDDLLNALATIIDKNPFEGISDEKLIMSAYAQINFSFAQTRPIIFLWFISNIEIKSKLKEIIIQKLRDDFDSELFVSASFRKIIDSTEFLEQYIKGLIKEEFIGTYRLSNKRPMVDDFGFINAMIFIYNLKLPINDQRLSGFDNLSEYMEFYLYPEQFDAEKFKVEWLFIGDREIFYQRFAKIPYIKQAIEQELKQNYDKDLAERYVKYFL
jgi:hypothetical protein